MSQFAPAKHTPALVSPGKPVAVQDLRARAGVPALRGPVERGPAERQHVLERIAQRQHAPAAPVQPPHFLSAAGEETRKLSGFPFGGQSRDFEMVGSIIITSIDPET